MDDAAMSEKERVACSECGQTFSKSSNLFRHYRSTHGIQVCAGRNPGGTVACPRCTQTFSKKSNMNRHCLQAHKVDLTRRARSQDSSDSEEGAPGCISTTAGLHEMTEAVLTMASRLRDDDLCSVVERARELDRAAKRLLEAD